MKNILAAIIIAAASFATPSKAESFCYRNCDGGYCTYNCR